jgi:FKBP-type peptidyl-prolyl cis-trans isomerase
MVPAHLSDSERIYVNVWMRDKLTDIGYVSFKQTFEQQVMARYTQQNRWNATLDTTTQIYYEVLKKKGGPQGTFSKVKVKYLLKLLNEQAVAYSKDGDPFIYDVNDKAVIGGIQFLAKKLKVGESGRALLPSSQAFGANGNMRVSGYTPIILELEVLGYVE